MYALHDIVFSNPKIKACYSTRHGGVSKGAYSSFNVALHVGDNEQDVLHNRALLQQKFHHRQIVYMNQVHGNIVCEITKSNASIIQDCDAIFTSSEDCALVVMTADCLPLLLASDQGVAAVHCGWRSLCNGIVQKTLTLMRKNGCTDIAAFIGPCIRQSSFEVGSDVVAAFCAKDNALDSFFRLKDNGKYLCDLAAICSYILRQQQVHSITDCKVDTYTNTDDFYSYRRESVTGRLLSAIALSKH